MKGGAAAALVGAGIFLSRILGLVRTRVMARYLGDSLAADAFTAALRIPNMLQNLFGEGALSASFIPVYARLVHEGRREEADRVAGAVLSAAALITALLVALGMTFAPALVDLIAFGFEGARRELTIRLVRILFPGIGLLVLAAWCLGVLNSHRRFFLSYAAPALWNVAIIGTLVYYGPRMGPVELAIPLAWGAVAGCVLQLGVQLPSVLRLVPGLRLNLSRTPEFIAVRRSFLPALASRGVAQFSAFIDQAIASVLPTGSVALLGYAQNLYTLPVSLFGMAVSAAELPELSTASEEGEGRAAAIRSRLTGGFARIAFFVVPSAAAFLFLGDVVAGALLQNGRFDRESTIRTWGILAGSAVGLVAGTMARLSASAFFAMRDTRTPLRIAIVRIVIGTAAGWLFATQGPAFLGIDPRWAPAGITLGSGLAAWIEFHALRRALSRVVGSVRPAPGLMLRLWGAALLAAACGYGVKLLLGSHGPVVSAAAVLSTFGLVYGTATLLLRVPTATSLWSGLARRLPRS